LPSIWPSDTESGSRMIGHGGDFHHQRNIQPQDHSVEVEVEYDYEAEFCDELTIRQGEVITNVKQMSGGWWEGTHPSGKHGLFPENFVKVINGVTTGESSSDTVHVELRKGKRCRVLFSYRPSHEDELELTPNEVIDFIAEVEDGWWRGKSADGSVGVFPRHTNQD